MRQTNNLCGNGDGASRATIHHRRSSPTNIINYIYLWWNAEKLNTRNNNQYFVRRRKKKSKKF